MKARQLINYLSHRYPRSGSTFPGDFFGLQLGKIPDTIESVIVGLDLNDAMIDLAIAQNVSLIIVHHPTLYPKKSIALKDPQIASLYKRAIEHQICVYSFHSNFDASPFGMNVALLRLLGATTIQKVGPHTTSYWMTLPEPRPLEEVAAWITAQWKLPFAQLLPSDNPSNRVQTIAVCAGSGTMEWLDAHEAGMDLFISGDSRHHQRVAMQRGHQHYLEVHHEIEKIFIPVVAQTIRDYAPQLRVIEAEGTPYPKLIIPLSY